MKLLIDGGWLIFKAAFPADGKVYVVDEMEFKYKKTADRYCDEFEIPRNEITIEYHPSSIAHACHNAKMLFEALIRFAGSDDYEIYVKTDEANFRNDLLPTYKHNRADKRRPYHEQNIKKYVLENYNCIEVVEIEEDDALGIAQSSTTCIVSHDKDLKMVPGHHIHCHKDGSFEKMFITEEEALMNYYTQCITGDVADNIPGLYKTTGKKVTKNILEGLARASDKWGYIRSIYGSGNFIELLNIAEALWILREKNS